MAPTTTWLVVWSFWDTLNHVCIQFNISIKWMILFIYDSTLSFDLNLQSKKPMRGWVRWGTERVRWFQATPQLRKCRVKSFFQEMTQMQVETEMEELSSCCWPEKMVKTEMKEMDWAWEDGIPGSERNVATGLSWLSMRFRVTESRELEIKPMTAHKDAPSRRRSRTDPNRAATTHLLCHLNREIVMFHYSQNIFVCYREFEYQPDD